MNERYEAWNEALLREYYPAGNWGRISVLPLDDDELRALAESYELGSRETAVADFISAVLTETPGADFTVWARRVQGWRTVRSSPPYIGALGFCVLAAMRMQRDTSAEIASTNYYTQLNRLLGRGSVKGAPPGFDLMYRVWEDLIRWLDVDVGGVRGASAVRSKPKGDAGWHVGYPISQALLRAHDRRRLPDFFRSVGLEPDTDVSQERLFIFLRAWAARPGCGLSEGGRRAIAAAIDIDLHEIAETVMRELRAWDGELRDERGRRRGALSLLVIDRGRRGLSACLVARRVPGFPTGVWQIDGSPRTIELEPHSASEEWFAPLSTPVDARVLERGFRLIRDDFALVYEPSDAIPCSQAPVELGGYVSRRTVLMWEPHVAITRRSSLTRLTDYLRTSAASALSEVRGDTNLPAAWTAVSPFRLTSAPGDPPHGLERFAPRLLSTMRLEGGLPLSPGVYLTGGEPDATVSVAEGEQLEIELDGTRQPVIGRAARLELSRLGLQPGEHELRADVTRRFSTVETCKGVRAPGTGGLGHRMSKHRCYLPETATVAGLAEGPPRAGAVFISGALALAAEGDLPLPLQPPVLARAGRRRYRVLGARAGEIVAAGQQQPPDWLGSLGLEAQFIDIRVAFPAVWLLTEASDGNLVVRAVDPTLEPELSSEPSSQSWASAVLEWKDGLVVDAPLDAWMAYVRAAHMLGSVAQ